jgi:hypothetical protein
MAVLDEAQSDFCAEYSRRDPGPLYLLASAVPARHFSGAVFDPRLHFALRLSSLPKYLT